MANLLEKSSILITPTAYSDGKIHSAKPIDPLGSEQVVNGDFATDSDWTKQTGWTISGGGANYDFSSNAAYIRQTLLNGGIVSGNTYQINFEITSGTAYISINSNGGVLISSNTYSVGSYSLSINASASGSDLLIYGRDAQGTAFSIDNVSVKEDIGADLDFTRGSSATRINADGLIESSQGINTPRINHENGVGSILLEPSSTNLITESEAFGNSYWTKTGVSIEGDASTAGSEEITNGDFATDTDWSKGANINISSGSANYTASPSGSSLTQSNFLTIGKMYKFVFSVSNFNSGAVKIRFPFNSSNTITSNGTFTEYSVATTDDLTFQAIGDTTLSIDNVSVKEVQGFASPSVDTPLGAFVLKSTGVGQMQAVYTGSIGVEYTASFWIKRKIGSGVVNLRSVENINTPITITNEWARYSLPVTSTSTSIRVGLRLDTVGDEVYIFASQLEAQSYATSYIPTVGTAISRTAESASKSGISSLINSEEGVLYAEISTFANDGTYRILAISDGTTDNRIYIQYTDTTNQLSSVTKVGGLTQGSMSTTLSNVTDYVKVAVKWSENDFALWVNGVEAATDTIGSVPSANTLNTFQFDDGTDGNDFYGKCKTIAVFPLLTDEELTCLTTI